VTDPDAPAALGTPETVAVHLTFLADHLELLSEARQKALGLEGTTWRVAAALLHGVVETGNSLALLVQGTRVRDSYVLARALFDTTLTTAFVLAGGEAVAERAERHARQKSYRDLARESHVAGQTLRLVWAGSADVSQQPELQGALAEYTGRKGQELRDWTPENATEQIEAVASQYGLQVATGLHAALFNVYRHASEAAHGTLFGVLHVLGVTLPGGGPRNEVEYDRHRCEHLAALCLIMGCALSSLLAILAVELHMPGLGQRAQQLWDPVQRQPWVGRA
jgi:hypothetical protein